MEGKSGNQTLRVEEGTGATASGLDAGTDTEMTNREPSAAGKVSKRKGKAVDVNTRVEAYDNAGTGDSGGGNNPAVNFDSPVIRAGDVTRDTHVGSTQEVTKSGAKKENNE
jgi:hypothetical protein